MDMLLDSSSPISQMIDRWWDLDVSGALISSLMVMALIAILAIVIGIKARRADPKVAPRGILLLAEMGVSSLDNWTSEMMGHRNVGNWPGYFAGLWVYLFISFNWSLLGLPSIIDYLLVPFTLSLVMFVLIQVTALRYQHLGYFHRYIEPLKIWLPINLVTMWTPIVSTSLRMFGNCISGSVIIGIVNWALKSASMAIFGAIGPWGQIFLAPFAIGVLNLYFSLFSGFVQTLVFASLNAVWIGAEMPEDEDIMGTSGQLTRGNSEAPIAQ